MEILTWSMFLMMVNLLAIAIAYWKDVAATITGLVSFMVPGIEFRNQLLRLIAEARRDLRFIKWCLVAIVVLLFTLVIIAME